jgi:autotransporter-associated beta strand protein
MVFLATTAYGATRQWTGAVDGKWMTTGNWAGGVAPAADDDLVFPPGATRIATTNDFPALTRFHSIAITSNYTFGGNAVTLGEGGLSGTTTRTTISFPLVLGSTQTWSGAFWIYSGVELNGFTLTLKAGDLGFFGTISGTGAIVKQGDGEALLDAENTYIGPTTIERGRLHITHTHGLGVADLAEGNGTAVQLGGELFIEGNGNFPERIALFGSDEGFVYIPQLRTHGTVVLSGPVVLAHGKSPIASVGTVRFEGPVTGPGTLPAYGQTYVFANPHNDFAGDIRSSDIYPTVIDVAAPGAMPINTPLYMAYNELRLNGLTHRLRYADVGTLNLGDGASLTLLEGGGVKFAIVGSGQIVVKSGAFGIEGTAAFDGDLLNDGGTVRVFEKGRLDVDFRQTAGAVEPHGKLGSVVVEGGVFIVNTAYTPGVPSVGELTLGQAAFYQEDFSFADAPGRVSVTGPVNLGGATFQLFMFPDQQHRKAVILSKAGTDPVIGTFAGLPEGSVHVADHGGLFRISYKAGDGNDIEVTGVSNTTLQLTSSMSPAPFGATVELTAKVTGSSPSGMVNFYDGPTLLGTSTLSGGTAKLRVSTLTAGFHPISAHYPGDDFNLESAANLPQQVTSLADVPMLDWRALVVLMVVLAVVALRR